jgi:acetolactate synthase I/II/III large subunit
VPAISGGHLVAKALRQEGVSAIFTLCGGHIMDIYDGCIEEKIRIIDVRHEQTAAHAADAWSRLTGLTGTAVVTAGPGVTGTVTAIANAFRAQSPMLVIGGQAPRKNLRKGGLQELNGIDIMKPITKFSGAIEEPERIPELIASALREAYNGRPGPVFLEISQDVLESEVDDRRVAFPVHARSKGRPMGDSELLEKACQLLGNAERPAVIAGSQIWHCRAVEQLHCAVSKFGLPTYLNGAARGCLPQDSRYSLNRSRRYALSRADVVLVIGTPLDFRLGYGSRISREARIIQVDLDYSELCHNRDVEIAIHGDLRAVLEQLAAARPASTKGEGWLDELHRKEVELSQQEAGLLGSNDQPIHPLRLAREINDFLTRDSIFIADGGDVVTMAASAIRTHRPGQWLDPGPLGTLGVGTPFAIAAKVAMPQSEVVILFGDGAFGFNGFDYDTLIRFNLPVIGVVANNAAWNQVRFVQLQKYGPAKGNVANLLLPTRYDLIVEAMGGYGEHVSEPSQIRPALDRARASGKPACINVVVNRDTFSASTRNLTIYQ